MSPGELLTSLTSLFAGVTAGYVMHRSNFCLAGAFRDLFLFRSTFMLKILTLLIAVAMLLLELVRQLGLIAIFPFPGFNAPALTTVFGGTLFGIGMVLAGGCVAGTLYKMGAGSVISLMAFIGLLVGSVLYAEFHGVWGAVAQRTRLPAGNETVAGMVGISQGLVIVLALSVLMFVVCKWQHGGMLVRAAQLEAYLQPWAAALILAVLVTISVVLIGLPLGVTTSYAKIGAWVEQLVLPERVKCVPYFQTISFKFDNRLLGTSYCGGPGPRADAVSLIQFPLIAGLVLGGMLSACRAREFRVHRAPVIQLLSAITGGVLMGLAARMAPSCNLWHLLGGLPILATQSLLFVAGLLPGAWLGSRFLERYVLRDSR